MNDRRTSSLNASAEDRADERYYTPEETEKVDPEELLQEQKDLLWQTKMSAENAIRHLDRADDLRKTAEESEAGTEAAERAAREAELQGSFQTLLSGYEEIRATIEQAYTDAEETAQKAEELAASASRDLEAVKKVLDSKEEAYKKAADALENAKQARERIKALLKAGQEEETATERARRLNDGTVVTVVCLTYNHEKFLAEALDSFVMQKTKFKFKVFVGDDCSTDNTREILRAYAEKYPDLIIPFYREKNMGAQHNLIDLCQRCTSPYIAFCEGDDYWVDEYKLQKQVEYMDSHPAIRVCVTQTEILAPADWHLRSWYKPVAGGKLLIPDSVPGYEQKSEYTPSNIIERIVGHTSTFFYRWNYDIEIPDWYYRGIIGDIPLLLLQMGKGNLGFIPEITSVYRINEGSAFFDRDRESSFLRTRLDYVRYLSGIVDYAKANLPGYPTVVAENRIKLEAANYLRTLIDRDDSDAIARFFKDYPMAGEVSLNAYLSFYHDQRAMTSTFGWEGYQLVARNKVFRHLLKPIVKLGLAVKRGREKRKKNKTLITIRSKLKNLASFILYWRYTLRRKDRNLWVFSGFNKTNYMDNSRYFYEYVLAKHPEIKAYWITLSDSVYNQLKAEGKPVLKMRTGQCRRIVSRAAIGVTDHFRMSDYDAFSGLNDGLKIVQLWHGVGLKSIGDLKNTDVPGVTYSQDIIAAPGDSGMTRFKKKLKYFRHAYFRELFEHYFLLACPGQERVEQVAKPLHIPVEACFFSGHPRNILLHQTQADTEIRRILYAPTYRWNVPKEKALVEQIVESADEIQSRMEELGAELTLRLHPHTWRNYNRILDRVAGEHSRIRVDHDKDIYTSLGRYSVVISDYSSIAYDFILLDRPVVFFNYDFEDFIRTECELNYDYDQYSPGAKTKTWSETLEAVAQYLADPGKDGEWRRRIRDEFYMMDVNDKDNSERIVQEIERRLNK